MKQFKISTCSSLLAVATAISSPAIFAQDISNMSQAPGSTCVPAYGPTHSLAGSNSTNYTLNAGMIQNLDSSKFLEVVCPQTLIFPAYGTHTVNPRIYGTDAHPSWEVSCKPYGVVTTGGGQGVNAGLNSTGTGNFTLNFGVLPAGAWSSTSTTPGGTYSYLCKIPPASSTAPYYSSINLIVQ